MLATTIAAPKRLLAKKFLATSESILPNKPARHLSRRLPSTALRSNELRGSLRDLTTRFTTGGTAAERWQRGLSIDSESPRNSGRFPRPSEVLL